MEIYNKLSNFKISSVLLAIGTAIGVTATPASAATFSLGDLISNNGTITVVDKVFSNFSCVKQGTGSPVNCGDINVNTLDTQNYGIQFQAGFNALAGNTVDFLLEYDVEASSDFLVHDVEMLFNGFVTGDAFAFVTETVTNLDPTRGPLNALLGQIGVTNPPQVLTADADLAFNAQKVHVIKDVQLSGGTNGIATISFINQRFSQVPNQDVTPVPEPASILSLLAFGYLGIALKRKKA